MLKSYKCTAARGGRLLCAAVWVTPKTFLCVLVHTKKAHITALLKVQKGQKLLLLCGTFERMLNARVHLI